MSDVELARWVGRAQERQDWVTPARIAAWDATFDYERPAPNYGDPAPIGFHWAMFPPLARTADLGADGHARAGTFLPPAPLPRRMWAGSRLVFHQPLRVGERIEQKSVIAAVEDKRRPAGRLVFVTVHHRTFGARGLAVEEEQDLVYREAPQPGAEPPDPLEADAASAWRRIIRPTETLLFRYSALTFNGHRIHYDRRYAESVEGYPGLVVHGPLLATLMLNMLQDRSPGAIVERFRFKARRPTFDISPFEIHGTAPDDKRHCRLWSTDNQGQLAMEADAWIR